MEVRHAYPGNRAVGEGSSIERKGGGHDAQAGDRREANSWKNENWHSISISRIAGWHKLKAQRKGRHQDESHNKRKPQERAGSSRTDIRGRGRQTRKITARE